MKKDLGSNQVVADSHEPGGEAAIPTRNFAPLLIGVVTGRSLSWPSAVALLRASIKKQKDGKGKQRNE
jgi:hypothetical protein